MRIAVIAPPWLPIPPPAYGGTELVLDGLCRGLAAAGNEVLLCATGDSTCPVDRYWIYETAIGVDGARPAAELSHVLDSYAAAITWLPDVIHDHTITGLAWGSLVSPVPVVTTNHGPFEGDLAAIYRHTAARVPIIAISNHQASTADGIPIGAVIHHGVDLDQIPYGNGGETMVFLGRMSPTKGAHTAIDVARKAGLPLRIAAKMREPAERDYFESIVRPKLGGDIEYIGEVGAADKATLLAEARCLLNPIEWPEPFGMVMIEALAAGTPVVTTPCGAAPEIVRQGVTGFVGTSVDELVTGVQEVGSIDRTTCRLDAEARFSIHRMAADHLAFYRQQIDGGLGGALVASGGTHP